LEVFFFFSGEKSFFLPLVITGDCPLLFYSYILLLFILALLTKRVIMVKKRKPGNGETVQKSRRTTLKKCFHSLLVPPN
jgi:hypothetical protein